MSTPTREATDRELSAVYDLLDAQRLRADTAEAELMAARQALDATRDALEAQQYLTAELRSRLSERDSLFSDLISSPHAVAVPLDLWKRIKSFADAALSTASPATINQQGEEA